MSLELFEQEFAEVRGNIPDLDKGMQRVVGPADGKIINLPDFGTQYRVMLDHQNIPMHILTAYEEIIPAGKSSPNLRLRYNEVFFYVCQGSGEIEIDNETHSLERECSGFVGRNRSFKTRNTGDTDLVLFCMAFPRGIEDLMESLAAGTAQVVGHSASGEPEYDWYEDCWGSDANIEPGKALVRKPAEVDSYWMPGEAMRGYIDALLTPNESGNPMYGVAMQQIEPGCRLSPHHHDGMQELLYVAQGSGKGAVDDMGLVNISPGTLLMHGRYRGHGFLNTGSDPLRLVVLLMPPTMMPFMSALGRKRVPGEPLPEPFEPPTAEEIANTGGKVGINSDFTTV